MLNPSAFKKASDFKALLVECSMQQQHGAFALRSRERRQDGISEGARGCFTCVARD